MEASDYSHKIHPTPKGCIAAPETPGRYFKAFADSGADEVAASSNKLPRSDLSVRPAPTVCFIWARCGGQKFPLFIFTPKVRHHVETQRFRAVKSSFYSFPRGTGMSVDCCASRGFFGGPRCYEIPRLSLHSYIR